MGAPQRIDETVDRDRLVRMQEEDDQEGSFLRPADSNRAALVPHLEWSEDPKLHALDRNRLVTGERHRRRRRLNEKEEPCVCSSSSLCLQCWRRCPLPSLRPTRPARRGGRRPHTSTWRPCYGRSQADRTRRSAW